MVQFEQLLVVEVGIDTFARFKPLIGDDTLPIPQCGLEAMLMEAEINSRLPA